MSPHFITTACLDWNDQGTPVAAAFDDVYFSNDDGLAESRYVFLGQNDLPNRWRNHDRPLFVVAETGFGTGLNVLATWQAFLDYRRQHPQGNAQRLHLISVEKYPLNHTDLSQALAQWPELSTLSARLLAEYPLPISGCHRLQLDENVSLDLWLGDVTQVLPSMEAGLSGKVDAWYLDGFAPSKNPEMWTPALFAQLARLARNGATLATFTAATLVRQGLTAAGFEMKRIKGFRHKREMLAGVLLRHHRQPYATPWFWRRPGRIGHTVIVGAGIAGACLAHALTRRGMRVTLLEQHGAPAQGASGNRQAAIYPLLNGEHDNLSQFYLQAFLHARRTLCAFTEQHKVAHDWCGVVQLAYDETSSAKITKLLAHHFPDTLLASLSAEQVNARTGIAANLAGLEYPLGGWICPFELITALLAQAKKTGLLHTRYQTQVESLQAKDEQWLLTTSTGEVLADNVFLANSHGVLDLVQTQGLALSAARGQVNYQASAPSLASLKTVVCYHGYLTPAWQGLHCIGASYGRDQVHLEYSATDEQENHHKLVSTLPALNDLPLSSGSGRVGVRATSRDHFPMAGAAPNKAAQLQQFDKLQRRQAQAVPLAEDHAGLYVLSGLGSRGVCSAPLLAELLAAQLCDEPYPVSRPILDSLAPNRHWARKLLRGQPLR
ncbi:bifunctional tRNA (5-methylaminomethyl-2-thiouridine)(34)-methyltransferase MnmD/FAD-dependent 5-carboxymethylaminomethyl-2-thiouridine(34) oxidoreductase MnmC [Oceanisphaera profunda]|uniref:tRNA 5-methylaminomethyl-2-thiouridine biosynthesis bifunctional protein MnmC n=1 Tax=Oceanisphaera profunda TaxID=1416627 RepID=A0A1Y0D1U1_9GAMM|nr:bifunctional tRNA (5-methylaminomethyl-2-thiouridine)(34)-methyltransferase MnmD/FAD-dependent 5-carboxymethylaminomethyl-2-thiouridine(34) oxidoreductase MnmC [Oceanisphaera profunda]ART81490.1 bifunctional tRNA (5-methylaminomethyl-2-thiouridine)(34)-methyltransferase MnmD/FAD-dependent 5-carboxymethylaminomethyl-2-thiouridine(34) oxidoreductase MnmC [Oceanisphaera profunda]